MRWPRCRFGAFLLTVLLATGTLIYMSTFDTVVYKYGVNHGRLIKEVSMQLGEIEMQRPADSESLAEYQDNKPLPVAVSLQDNGLMASSTRNSEVPFRQFVKDQPKSVILLAYQRTGSSFIAGVFNSNPDNAFYVFEPLDALYSSMYGTTLGWNVPSDITAYSNGTNRMLPRRELAAVASFLGDVFTCDVDRWPVEALSQPYWNMFRHSASGRFAGCIARNSLTAVAMKCLLHTTSYCGKRFGAQPEERLEECNRLVTNASYRDEHPSAEVRQAFRKYANCTAALKKKADGKCTPVLQKTCSQRPLRAVKTVRATMDSMEPLLRKLPNFRVIHLIRDPRAVALSRKQFSGSGRGHFSNKAGQQQMTNEAMLYCRTVARDVRTRRRLSVRYPGRIYPILYDDVVRDLDRYTKNVYQFLDEPVSPSTLAWVEQNLHQERNGTTIASNWLKVLSVEQNMNIVSVCSELFGMLYSV